MPRFLCHPYIFNFFTTLHKLDPVSAGCLNWDFKILIWELCVSSGKSLVYGNFWEIRAVGVKYPGCCQTNINIQNHLGLFPFRFSQTIILVTSLNFNFSILLLLHDDDSICLPIPGMQHAYSTQQNYS